MDGEILLSIRGLKETIKENFDRVKTSGFPKHFLKIKNKTEAIENSYNI